MILENNNKFKISEFLFTLMNKFKMSELLFIFMPLALITGPFLADLSVCLIVLIFFINFKVETHFRYFKNKFFYFFFILNIWFIASSLFSDNILISLKTSFFYFRFYIFSLAVWFILDTNERVLKYFFYILLFTFTILIFDGFFQYIFDFNILGWELHPGPRISSFFKDELILGSYISRSLPLLLGFFLYFFEKNKKFLYSYSFIFLILTETLTFLSGERVAFFYINLSCLVLILCLNKYNLLRLFSYLVSILLITLIVTLSPASKERIIDKTISQTGILTPDKTFFSSDHERIFNSALEIIKNNKISGVGPNNFKEECKIYLKKNPNFYICATHPHNTYLELLAETGIPGFLMISALFIYLNVSLLHHLYLRVFKKHVQKYSNLEVCLLTAIYISLFPFIPTGSFFNNYLSIIYYLPVGIFLWKVNKK